MASIDVTVIDVTGSREQVATLPDDAAVRRIIAKLVDLMSLPTHGPDGAPLSYRFHHKASGRQLSDEETLAGANVRPGDVLRLQPEIVAG
ncbi:MAG: EsaB/YukD family protein [Acidimicrobiales bacterium]|nr:EsaB/YukD family protein [Acidimicrobiales bacterium]